MYFTNFYRSNRPILFDSSRRYSDEEVFARLRVHLNRKVYFHFDDNLCVPVFNEDELGICSRMFSMWHNSMQDESSNLILNGYLRTSHDIFHLPDNHFKCSLFPTLRSSLAPELKNLPTEETTIIIEGVNDIGDSEMVQKDPMTPDLSVIEEASYQELEEPDWCSSIVGEEILPVEPMTEDLMIDDAVGEGQEKELQFSMEMKPDNEGIPLLIETDLFKKDLRHPQGSNKQRPGKYSL